MHQGLNVAFTLIAMSIWGAAGYQLAKHLDEQAYSSKIGNKRQRKALLFFIGGAICFIVAYAVK